MRLKIDQLSKTFNQTQAVKDVSFTLEAGNCFALLGPNGAGKTTTLRMLSGLLKPTSGTIDFEGFTGHDIREKIGYLPQYPSFYGWMSGKEFLVYVGQLAALSKQESIKRADSLLELVGITKAKHRRISKYSGGMKQRLGIAQAMIHQPSLIMLDEPVSSLDPIGRREVLNLMEALKEKTTILFSTHILSDAEEISDGLILMHEGRVLEQGLLTELHEKYQSQKIELSFKAFSENQLAVLSALPGIREVTPSRTGLTCFINDPILARQSILAKTIEENWQLNQFSLAKMTLEEMFMEVIGQ
ncbi:ABC-2 type transport system ATP-binding protein [Amphibacillus marinus]|uniref:ABC-2 type transport system ATP-binding protein n=1 Tax=Amphibacillus marinus TaxID=872970 RepID=A0A1H8RH86_9BACI|nr:ABC transporter ATP-binding protein [Amphibacillus marinus]SEO65627.1 ABC-2 type transport system ATP-binding protein [Amphibacillus marinus]